MWCILPNNDLQASSYTTLSQETIKVNNTSFNTNFTKMIDHVGPRPPMLKFTSNYAQTQQYAYLTFLLQHTDKYCSLMLRIYSKTKQKQKQKTDAM